MSEDVRSWVDEIAQRTVDAFIDPETDQIDLDALIAQMQQLYGTDITAAELREDKITERNTLAEEFAEDMREEYAAKEEDLGSDLIRELERFVILQVVDTRWREHLENMDYMREGVHLRAMAQKDPLVEYRSEGHAMFEELSRNIREEVLSMLFHAQLAPEEADELRAAQERQGFTDGNLSYEHTSLAGADAIAAAGMGGDEAGVLTIPRTEQRIVSEQEKIGRNDPCWCGSGKKFKKCHGA